MHHIMFDVDGTLVQSGKMDAACFIGAVSEVLKAPIDPDWDNYVHITDAGILDHHLRLTGLMANRDDIHHQVRQAFVRRIKEYLQKHPLKEIMGAARFIRELKSLDAVTLSIATGGWLETAQLKLESAGIDIADIPIASSNDHYARTEIMKLARQKAGVSQDNTVTYFGDAEWDKASCRQLGYNFVLVGNRTSNPERLDDLTSVSQALSFIGLNPNR